jgi:predicted phosphoadenosine phosphosulfate sulfurtransferase
VRLYTSQSVLDAALERINWVFDEFETVVVSTSGGKDSTVVYELAKAVARERSRLPLTVFWLDQECEFEATVNYVRDVMYDPDVTPMWMQIPFRLQNATSQKELWLNCWGEGEEWVREKDPISIKENTYGTDRFVAVMEAIMDQTFTEPTAILTGVRGDESPGRMMAATETVCHKYVTWGAKSKGKHGHVRFSPLYDWRYTDVWKAIHDNGWAYNSHYDDLYRYGIPPGKMRVSNYHHETALQSLFWLQEIEPETYDRATRRISGLDTAGKMGAADYFPRELPFMFRDWREYRDYLLEHLIIRDDMKKRMAAEFANVERRFPADADGGLYRVMVTSILANDYELTKLKNWMNSKGSADWTARRDAHAGKFKTVG